MKDANSSSFIRFQCLLHESGVFFSGFWNFLQLKRWDQNSCGEPILQNGSIIWSPLLYLNFRTFKDPNSLSFIRFQSVLHDSGVFFSGFRNFPKLKNGDLLSWGNQFCRTAELFGRPFCVSILEVWTTQILRHSLDFNVFYIIQQYFSQVFDISSNERVRT